MFSEFIVAQQQRCVPGAPNVCLIKMQISSCSEAMKVNLENFSEFSVLETNCPMCLTEGGQHCGGFCVQGENRT